MNDNADHSPCPSGAADQPFERALAPSRTAAFFERADWLSFWITTTLVLVVYLCTLAPDVTLGFSGILATGGKYAGVPHPPGYPPWTVYAWLFTKSLPFSNIAWRVAVSSAVAGAVTCGVIARMVSRGGSLIVGGMPGLKKLEPKDANLLRVVAGSVAGMAFGFDGAFWGRAVIVDTWPLSILLFSIVLGFLMRWMWAPGRNRYLYAGCFIYGLTLSNSQALFAAAPGLQLLMMFGDLRLGREIFLANSILFIASLVPYGTGYLRLPYWYAVQDKSLLLIYLGLGLGSTALCIGLAAMTRSFHTEWKRVMVSGVMFLVGAASYLYVPIASMTNPPVNWGYPRTVEGFFHVLSRGQYQRISPTNSLDRLAQQLQNYADVAISEFGLAYLLIALIPFCFLHRMRTNERGWMLGLSAVYVCLALLLLVVLNPANDRASREISRVFFSASHLVLAVWTGYGLALLGALLVTRSTSDRVSPLSPTRPSTHR